MTDPASTTGTGAPRLAGRLALVTGASRGLGAAVARRFAAEGARLVLVARTVGGLEEVDDAIRGAGGPESTLVPLDLAKHDQIDALGQAIYERFGKLDIVVGAAAMLGALGPVAHSDPKLWHRVLDVNLTANYRLIRSLHPLLQVAEAGRAIFVTCAAGHSVKPFWSAYAVAKAGLEMMVKQYAAETTKTPIRANLVDPGPLPTRLRNEAYPGEDPSQHPDPATATGAFVELAEAGCTQTGMVVTVADR